MFRTRVWSAALLMGVTLASASLSSAGADETATIRTAQWSELMPAGGDVLKELRAARELAGIKEGSAQEVDLMREMRAAWDNAPTRGELDGTKIRLPGYVVPIEGGSGDVREFLLVPYFGACIHAPPPPANQIVHVVLAEPRPLRTMEAVWASGTLRVRRQDSSIGVMSGYWMEGLTIEPYVGRRRPLL